MHYDPTRVDSSPFYLYRTEPSGQSFQRSSACIRTWKGWVSLGLLHALHVAINSTVPYSCWKDAEATWPCEGYLKEIQGDKNRHCYWGTFLGLCFFLGITNTGDWKVHTFDAGQEPSQGNPDLTPGDFPAPPVSDQSNLQRSIGEGCGG